MLERDNRKGGILCTAEVIRENFMSKWPLEAKGDVKKKITIGSFPLPWILREPRRKIREVGA